MQIKRRWYSCENMLFCHISWQWKVVIFRSYDSYGHWIRYHIYITFTGNIIDTWSECIFILWSLCLSICLSVLCTAKVLDMLSIFSVLKSKVVMKYLTLRQNDIHWEMWFIFVSFISRPRSSNIPVQNCSCLHSLIGLSIADEDYWLNTLKTPLSDRKGTGRKYLLFIWQHLPIPARPWYLFMIDR